MTNQVFCAKVAVKMVKDFLGSQGCCRVKIDAQAVQVNGNTAYVPVQILGPMGEYKTFHVTSQGMITATRAG